MVKTIKDLSELTSHSVPINLIKKENNNEY